MKCTARGSLKIQDAKIAKNLPPGHHRTTCRAISSQLRHISTIGKKLLKSNIFSRRPHNMANLGPLTAEIGLPVSGTQQILTGFASWLHYCSDVALRRPTKLCTIFGRLLSWHTVYAFFGLLPLDGILPGANLIHFASKSCVLINWQRHCTALHQSNFEAWYKKWN